MWIEMIHGIVVMRSRYVTPLAGVWIEIYLSTLVRKYEAVTPLAGVWIEIAYLYKLAPRR